MYPGLNLNSFLLPIEIQSPALRAIYDFLFKVIVSTSVTMPVVGIDMADYIFSGLQVKIKISFDE